jgi:hypothetical protein
LSLMSRKFGGGREVKIGYSRLKVSAGTEPMPSAQISTLLIGDADQALQPIPAKVQKIIEIE